MGILEDVKEEIKKDVQEVSKSSDGRGFLDVVSEKAVSRKLLVWIVSTTMLALGKITSEDWISISLGYIGIQGVADLATKWKGANKNVS